MTPYIPAATANRLNGHAPEGTRHAEALKIAISLVGNGLSPSAVFVTLREKFPPDVTDGELQRVVRWAEEKNPTPSGFGKSQSSQGFRRPTSTAPAQPVREKSPLEHCQWWLNGSELTPERFAAKSPVPIPEEPKDALIAFFDLIYAPDDRLNIVCKFLKEGEKARPCGGGKTQSRVEWVDFLAGNPVPQSEAGAWFRFNPCGEGTGSGGAITDADIAAHRFLLIESDTVPIGIQLGLFAALKIPLAAVYMSGGLSAHALVKLDAPTAEAYTASVARILAALKPFGIDQANKNPSRLSRLPSAVRTIGGVDGGLQRLLWLKPNCQPLDDAGIDALERALAVPVVDEMPLRALMNSATSRYEDLYLNRGKLGVPTGLSDFDRDTGGLKKGHIIVIAAQTNVGKSTVALNMANAALQAGHGVAFFSLEMDRDEIFDLLVCMNCRVDRNSFNTGHFMEGELMRITSQADALTKLPLWIFDDPALTVEKIGRHIEQLAGKISLVVIDYVQIVAADDSREPREQQVANIAHGLRVIARQNKLPMIMLSQLNDEGKLRESRVVGQNANAVFMLEAEDENIILKVIKGRGIRKKDYVASYEPIYCKITSAPRIDRSDVPRHND